MGPKKKWNILSFHVLLAFSSNLLSVFNKCEIIKPARYPKIAIWYILKKHRIKELKESQKSGVEYNMNAQLVEITFCKCSFVFIHYRFHYFRITFIMYSCQF